MNKPLVFISAGEVSGDIYGAALIQALAPQKPCHFVGLGGENMISAGLKPLAHILPFSAVGLVENLRPLPYFWQLFQRLRVWLRQTRPDLMILIDFQGLNLRLAALAQTLGIPVVYFIAPQEWLWRVGQGPQRVAQRVNQILAVFPPEAQVYQAAGANVRYIGHPLLDLLPATEPCASQPTTVCLMPGSRKLEIERLLPALLTLGERLYRTLGMHALLPLAASHFDHPPARPWLKVLPANERYQAMNAAQLVVGASGSMILESVLLGRPVVALYRVAPLTYAVARRLIQVPWITLPNILLERPLVPELLQHWTADSLFQTCQKTLAEPQTNWREAQTELREMLGPPGAFLRAAESIIAMLET